MKTIFGIKGFAIDEYAITSSAILGIRDSGKTYTATEAAEELFRADIPFVAFDPIGVWHTLRLPGKGRGYPVVVAGGAHGDLPLTKQNVGPIVTAAMENGISLVLDFFSPDLSAKSTWRSIVRQASDLLMHNNAKYGLRHIFLEEAAEFVPQVVRDGEVFDSVERIVRMGGNAKLGVTLINQRAEDMNKSVLENCATVFLHRQRGRNSLTNLKKQIDKLEPKDADKIIDSVPDLVSGECWVLSSILEHPIRVKIPAKTSQHPDRRAKVTADTVRAKPVPADKFVEAMKAALAPKPSPKSTNVPRETIKPAPAAHSAREIAAAREEGRREGFGQGWEASAQVHYDAGISAFHKAFSNTQIGALTPQPVPKRLPPAQTGQASPVSPAPATASAAPAQSRAPRALRHTASTAPARAAPGNLPRSLQTVVDALAWWGAIGFPQVERARAAVVAGLSPTASTFGVYISKLTDQGLAETTPGKVGLTAAGLHEANIPAMATRADIQRTARAMLDNMPARVFDIVYVAWPNEVSRDAIADALDLSRTASTVGVYISKAAAIGVIGPGSPKHVIAADWLFPEGIE